MRKHNKRRIEAPHVAVHGKTTYCVFSCFVHLRCLVFSPAQDLESSDLAADVKRLSMNARVAMLERQCPRIWSWLLQAEGVEKAEQQGTTEADSPHFSRKRRASGAQAPRKDATFGVSE